MYILSAWLWKFHEPIVMSNQKLLWNSIPSDRYRTLSADCNVFFFFLRSPILALCLTAFLGLYLPILMLSSEWDVWPKKYIVNLSGIQRYRRWLRNIISSENASVASWWACHLTILCSSRLVRGGLIIQQNTYKIMQETHIFKWGINVWELSNTTNVFFFFFFFCPPSEVSSNYE